MSSYNKTHPESIQQMFGAIAERYDLTNAILSFQLHKYWNAKLARLLIPFSQQGPFLDLCCGTGDITFSLLKKLKKPTKVFMVDFCQEMLTCAQEKASKLQLDQHELVMMNADAQEIPLSKEEISCVSIAYGIRNVTDPLQCVKECHRILVPGGVCGILELTRPNNRLLQAAHSFYLQRLLPLLGKLFTSNQEAYQYLCQSIQNFISPKDLKKLLVTAGFQKVEVLPLHGGIATILLAYKNH